jgi:predicted phage tail protein
MKKIVLHGALGEQFGHEWNLDVATPSEALRLIQVNRNDLIPHLLKSAEQGVGYRVIVGDRDVGVEDLSMPYGRETLHIVPVAAGAKSGLGSIIIGAMLMVLAIPSGGASMGLWTALSSGASFGQIAASLAFSIGSNLVLGGLSQMLAGAPKQPAQQEVAVVENKPSYYFNGPVNTIAQGSVVPVGYGTLVVGGMPISAGINAENWAI